MAHIILHMQMSRKGRSSSLLPVQIRPRRRQAARAFRALRDQRLKDAAIAALEGERAGGEIGEIDARLHFADFAARFLVTRGEPVVPEAAGALIVLAPALDIVHLEAVRLEIEDRAA